MMQSSAVDYPDLVKSKKNIFWISALHLYDRVVGLDKIYEYCIQTSCPIWPGKTDFYI